MNVGFAEPILKFGGDGGIRTTHKNFYRVEL